MSRRNSGYFVSHPVNDMVIASAGMLLPDHKIAIDPVDEESASIFTAAGYWVVKADEFQLGMVVNA